MTGSDSQLSRHLQASLSNGTTCEDIALLLAGSVASERRVNLGGSGRWRQIVVTHDRETIIFEYDRHDTLLAYGIGSSQPDDVDAGAGSDEELPSGLALTLARDVEKGGDGP